MKKYIVRYYFDKEFSVTRFVNSEDKESALIYAFPEGNGEGNIIKFEDSKGVMYRFSKDDVRLTSIIEDDLPGSQ